MVTVQVTAKWRPRCSARASGIIDALNSANVMTFADKAYQGARGSIRTPFKRHRHRHRHRPKLPRWQKKVNRAHARIRAIGERANATLKTWKVLTKLRCCPHRATAILQAILVLHHVENPAYAG
ncbi:transposase family protein [Micromonospora sp. NPDC052213]|uniref:transposase family protein n=1 Tax=Micromonospora sp. NPDC052213 TaxID=3155812 RepID=UPI0034293C41